MTTRTAATCLVVAILAMSAASLGLAQVPGPGKAPGSKGKTKPGSPQELKRLDTRLDEVRDAFLRETYTLITSYENMGQYERARSILESLQRLDPRNEPIKQKLGELTEKLLESSELPVDLVPGGPWMPVGAVTKDRPIRIAVTGEYKFVLSTEFGPAGVGNGTGDDFFAGAPLGAVVGMIASSGPSGQPVMQADRQPRPFTVSDRFEKPADRDGILFLRINVPAVAKCTGRLAARVSGPERPGQ